VYAVEGIDPDEMRVLSLPHDYLDTLWQPSKSIRQFAIMEALRFRCTAGETEFSKGMMATKTKTALAGAFSDNDACGGRKEMVEWAKKSVTAIPGTAMLMIKFLPDERDYMVLGPQDSTEELGKSVTLQFKRLLAKALGSHFAMTAQDTVEWRPFFLATKMKLGHGQSPHVDHEFAGPTRRLKRPLWAMDMPLTSEGVTLKVWPGADEMNTVYGRKLFFKKGEICLRRATLIHAGGMNGPNGGSALRMHASLAVEDDQLPQLNLLNGGTYGTDPRSISRISFKRFCK
jgi:hypothetical protein